MFDTFLFSLKEKIINGLLLVEGETYVNNNETTCNCLYYNQYSVYYATHLKNIIKLINLTCRIIYKCSNFT